MLTKGFENRTSHDFRREDIILPKSAVCRAEFALPICIRQLFRLTHHIERIGGLTFIFCRKMEMNAVAGFARNFAECADCVPMSTKSPFFTVALSSPQYFATNLPPWSISTHKPYIESVYTFVTSPSFAATTLSPSVPLKSTAVCAR